MKYVRKERIQSNYFVTQNFSEGIFSYFLKGIWYRRGSNEKKPSPTLSGILNLPNLVVSHKKRICKAQYSKNHILFFFFFHLYSKYFTRFVRKKDHFLIMLGEINPQIAHQGTHCYHKANLTTFEDVDSDHVILQTKFFEIIILRFP